MRYFALATIATLALAVGPSLGQSVSNTAKSAPPSKVTDAQLRTMLDNMGYTYKVLPAKNNGPNSYEITLSHEGFSYHVEVGLSPNQARVWVYANLAPLSPSTQVPEQRLEQLLEKSNAFMPAFFSLQPGARELYINDPIDNSDVTPARLRTEIENVVDDIHQTRSLWFPSPAPTPAPAPVVPPVGK